MRIHPKPVHAIAWLIPATLALVTGAAQAQRPDMTINSMATRDMNYELNNRSSTEGKLRPEVSILLMDAQRMINSMEPVGAEEKIVKAERWENKSAYELHLIARVRGMLAISKRNPDEAAKQYLIASEGKWMLQPDRISSLESIASLYYHKKDYAKSAVWFDRYAEAGGTDANSGMLRAQSYYLIDDFGNTAKVLDAELARAMTASKAPPELLLKLLVDSKERINDMDGSKKAALLLAQYYPGKAN